MSASLHHSLRVADLHTHPMLGVGYLGLGLRGGWPRWALRGPLRNLLGLVTPEQARRGGVDLLVFVIYQLPNPRRSYRAGLRRQLRRFEALCARYAGTLQHVRSSEEIERAWAGGKVAVLLALEGGHSIERHPEDLVWLRDKGLVYLTISHFIDNRLCGTATHPLRRRWGLSRRGREVVRLCDELGIVLDVTHSSDRARREIARLSRLPVIYSHTGLRRFVPLERMQTEADMRAVARDGGLVGQLLSPYFVSGRLHGDVDEVARNLEYMCEVMGPEHVAIGSDFDSGLNPPAPLRSIADYPLLTAAMQRRGLGRAAIEQIWSGSFLRLLRAIGR
ncbi:MAG: hypothetical protein D6776_00465 [Planctomycetota bacterium]|nr:MAG: hypothetical protein D6776_00465 [Planctomycetota bacterium]